MRTGRPKQALRLTEEERERLQSLTHRARSQPLQARRARVVLASAEGLDNKTVALKLRTSLGMVGKWRSRFLEAWLEGLHDEPRPGAPRKVRATPRSKKSLSRPWKARRAAKRIGAREA
jgi:transposase